MKRFLLASASLIVAATAVCADAPATGMRSAGIERRLQTVLTKAPAPAPTSSSERASVQRPASRTKRSSQQRQTTPRRATTDPFKLSWPVTGRKIIEPYGERVNPKTKTVTLNPGVNISARKGSTVRAAAAGKISLVSWLPSYGTFVIVEHRDGYRTVYANLGSTVARRGKRVASGARIGAVGASPRGTFLHFQVWREQTRLDPTSFLRE